MNMSKAALPPIQPHVSDADRAHYLFPVYQAYRNAMSVRLVEADSFATWLASRESEAIAAQWHRHAAYPAFLAWMRETQAGARGKLRFPDNFIAWLDGERW